MLEKLKALLVSLLPFFVGGIAGSVIAVPVLLAAIGGTVFSVPFIPMFAWAFICLTGILGNVVIAKRKANK